MRQPRSNLGPNLVRGRKYVVVLPVTLSDSSLCDSNPVLH